MDRCRIHCEEPYSLLFVCLSILHKLPIVCQQCHVTSERLDLIHNSRLAEALNMNKNPRICKQKVVAREVFFFEHVFAYISDTFRLRRMVPNFNWCLSARVTITDKSIYRIYGNSLQKAVWRLAVYVSALSKLGLYFCVAHCLHSLKLAFILLDVLFTSVPSQSV